MLSDAFGKYDIRGIYPKTINENMFYCIGRAVRDVFGGKKFVVGCDARISGIALKTALCKGLVDSDCEVFDIGLCGTEMIYFAVAHLGMDGGFMVTASHNPKEYNGLKFVGKNSQPITKREMDKIKKSVNINSLSHTITKRGMVKKINIIDAYIKNIISNINVNVLKPLKIVTNAGNGTAGCIIDALEKYLPFEFVKIHHEPNGVFPNGIPNPLLCENRKDTSIAVCESGADMGVAWDGDFDRCFIFDEKGHMIEGYYLVGYLAQRFLKTKLGDKVIHDERLIWNTIDIIRENGGVPVISRCGHTFFKEKMRELDAVYGGEMSSHHYFRSFSYCDSGMIPWLLVSEELSKTSGIRLSELMKPYVDKYPISGEINVKVKDADFILQQIEKEYGINGSVSKSDGISIMFDKWRFNLRKSNTEPLLRLNIETKYDKELLNNKRVELLEKITEFDYGN